METFVSEARIKRSVDVVLSAILLLFALPLLLVAALLICLTSPGPILFRQTRMGRSFETFQIFKLRTMAHGEPGLAYTLGRDPRITPLGHFLRRSKIDELPQLWNVLIGDMSLVGPRPVLPELTYEFREYYVFLLRARPGLTDPASLKYSQEASLLSRAPDPMEFFKSVVTPDKLRISFEYMSRANAWTDIATLGMTAAICCWPSLSRVYGDPPVLVGTPASKKLAPRPQPKRTLTIIPPPVNESVFSHQLALQEVHAEEASHRTALPWIPRPVPNFNAQSAPSRTEETA